MDNIVKFYQAEKYEEEGIIFEIDADQKANEIYQQVSKALASKGLMIDKVDLQKMNLWDMNNNQKYTEINESESQPAEQPKEQPKEPQSPAAKPIAGSDADTDIDTAKQVPEERDQTEIKMQQTDILLEGANVVRVDQTQKEPEPNVQEVQ